MPLTYAVGADTEGFAALLQEMRVRAGMTVTELSRKLRMRPGSIYQYFYRKRGVGGSSTMRWFLRYAEACGCEVTLRFPPSPRDRRANNPDARPRPAMGLVMDAPEEAHAETDHP